MKQTNTNMTILLSLGMFFTTPLAIHAAPPSTIHVARTAELQSAQGPATLLTGIVSNDTGGTPTPKVAGGVPTANEAFVIQGNPISILNQTSFTSTWTFQNTSTFDFNVAVQVFARSTDSLGVADVDGSLANLQPLVAPFQTEAANALLPDGPAGPTLEWLTDTIKENPLDPIGIFAEVTGDLVQPPTAIDNANGQLGPSTSGFAAVPAGGSLTFTIICTTFTGCDPFLPGCTMGDGFMTVGFTGTVTNSPMTILDPQIADSNNPKDQGTLLIKVNELQGPVVNILPSAHALSMKGKPIIGYAADGVTEVFARFMLPPLVSTVTFTIVDENGQETTEVGTLFDIYNPAQAGTSVTVSEVFVGGNHWAFVGLRAPRDFVRANNPNDVTLGLSMPRTLKLIAKDAHSGDVLSTRDFEIHRPPIMLIHGVASSSATWDLPLLQQSPLFLIHKEDYSKDAFMLKENIIHARSGVHAAVCKLRALGIAATQADVITHSMGGLLTRLYIGGDPTDAFQSDKTPYRRVDNFLEGDVHKLILGDSPQLGARLATLVVNQNGSLTLFGLKLQGILSIRTLGRADLTAGAVGGMRPDVLSLPALPPQGVPAIPVHAIVGTGGNTAAAELLLGAAAVIDVSSLLRIPGIAELTKTTVFEIIEQGITVADFFAMDNDLIVGRDSQEALIPAGSKAISLFPWNPAGGSQLFDINRLGIHTTVTKDNDRIAPRLIDLLNARVQNKVFVQSLPAVFPSPVALPLENSVTRPLLALSAGVEISAPSPGTVVQPGDMITVAVQPVGGFVLERVLVIAGAGNAGADVQLLDAPPFQATMQVVPTAIGEIGIVAIGIDINGNEVGSSVVMLNVNVPASLSGMTIEPQELLFFAYNSTASLKVLGSFDDGVDRDLTPSNLGTIYQSADPAIATVDVDGVITAHMTGTTTILITNGGFSTSVNIDVASSKGDFNGDGVVNVADFGSFARCFSGPTTDPGFVLPEARCLDIFDFDVDTDIDLDDFNAFLAIFTGPLDDCNANGTLDMLDILQQSSSDCNENGIADECEIDVNSTAPGGPFFCIANCNPDCNNNGIPDECDRSSGTSQDCNNNGIPDDCDIASGASTDTNNNGIPDDCEDCNANGVLDITDIAMGASTDCNANSVPDECDIATGTSQDCNANGIPDECDISVGTSQDCQPDGIPDECQMGMPGFLATTLAAGEVRNGAMFDLTVLNPNGITIRSFEWNNGSAVGPANIEVWFVTDHTTFVGKEFSQGLWTQMGSASLSSVNPAGTPTPVAIGGETLNFGETVGIYFTRTDGLNLSNTIGPLGAFANNDVLFEDRGSSSVYPFGTIHFPAIWNGTIFYNVVNPIDCNSNFIPDGCEPDCNANGVPDDCDLTAGTSSDCNGNGIPDECDISSGSSLDTNGDGIPDECEDCNGNGVLDNIDIAGGTSQDCNANGVPDECEGDFISFQYLLDDGTGELDFGFTGGADLIWLNQFTVTPGAETIKTASIAWGLGAAGTPTTIVLWDDPNNDGIPSDAVVLATVGPIPATNPNTGQFTTVAIPPTVVGQVGDSFFVGALITHADGEFPAFLDQTPPSQGRSWFLGRAPGTGNINNLSGISLIDGIGAPGNWLLRADGEGVIAIDCNSNGILDECDIAAGTSQDCNANGIPDECDLTAGTSLDCNANGIPDECDVDCNTNGVPDACDLTVGTSLDCNGNGIPDECDVSVAQAQDSCVSARPICPGISLTGSTSVASGDGSASCGNSSSVCPDVWYSYTPAVNGTLTFSLCGSSFAFDTVLSVHTGCPGTPANEVACSDDFCSLQSEITHNVTAGITYFLRISGYSCDSGDFVLSLTGPPCQGGSGSSLDCNANAIPDECDIAGGTSLDTNLNGIPDECELSGDVDCNGAVDVQDVSPFVQALIDPAAFVGCDINRADLNGDTLIDGADIQGFVAAVLGP